MIFTAESPCPNVEGSQLMIHRIKTMMAGIPVMIEIRLRPDKDSIAEKVGQGIDVESVENQLRSEFVEWFSSLKGITNDG